MNNIQVTSVSSKGQVVIPNNIRETMGISEGAKLFIFTDGENLLLKPITDPEFDDFKSIIKASRNFISKTNITQADVKKLIKNVRKKSST